MGIFSSIIDRIFHHANAATGSTGTPSAQPGQSPSPPTAAAPTASVPRTEVPRLQDVDVHAVLTQAAAKKGGGGNWQTSIVDLLKLLDLDPGLAARKELANELNVHVGADGSAEQNIALHRAVINKIAENGGKVPDSLRH